MKKEGLIAQSPRHGHKLPSFGRKHAEALLPGDVDIVVDDLDAAIQRQAAVKQEPRIRRAEAPSPKEQATLF